MRCLSLFLFLVLGWNLGLAHAQCVSRYAALPARPYSEVQQCLELPITACHWQADSPQLCQVGAAPLPRVLGGLIPIRCCIDPPSPSAADCALWCLQMKPIYW